MKLEFRFKGLKVCSNNDMYLPSKGKKGKGAFLRRSPYLHVWQGYMSEMMSTYPPEVFEEFKLLALNERRAVTFSIEIGIPRNQYLKTTDLKAHDTSNMIKAIEDCISSGIGLDDKYNIHVVATKGFTMYPEWTYIVTLELGEPNSMYNQFEYEDYDKFYDLEGDDNDDESRTNP